MAATDACLLPNLPPQCSSEAMLFLAASAENGSEHPLAQAVLAYGAERLPGGSGEGSPGAPLDAAPAEDGSGSSEPQPLLSAQVKCRLCSLLHSF